MLKNKRKVGESKRVTLTLGYLKDSKYFSKKNLTPGELRKQLSQAQQRREIVETDPFVEEVSLVDSS